MSNIPRRVTNAFEPSDDPRIMIQQFMVDKPSARLGRCLAEYIVESNHSGWDGFTSRDLTGIKRFLADLQHYYEVMDKDNPTYWDERGFGGVVHFTAD